MSDLVSQAQAIQSNAQTEDDKRKDEAREALVQIALREIQDKTKETDAEELAEALSLLGEPVDHYIELREAIPAVARAEGVYRYCQEKKAMAPEKFREYAKLKAVREFEIAVAKQEFDACEVSFALSSACLQIRTTHEKFPQLFDDRPGSNYPEVRYLKELTDEQVTRERDRELTALVRVSEQAERSAKPMLRQSGAIA